MLTACEGETAVDCLIKVVGEVLTSEEKAATIICHIERREMAGKSQGLKYKGRLEIGTHKLL